MTNFNKILETTSNDEKDSLTIQALKRQEYNRQYQARLRERAKLITLERKIDANLQFVIGYIKEKYSAEYKSYTKSVEQEPTVKPEVDRAFNNWLLLSAQEYKSVQDAYEVSTLSEHMSIKEFSKLFEKHYKQNNRGRYTKY